MVLIEKILKNFLIWKKSFIELRKTKIDIEKKIQKTLLFNKINYLSIMMVDKNVHLHIIPRYKRLVKFNMKNYRIMVGHYYQILKKNYSFKRPKKKFN